MLLKVSPKGWLRRELWWSLSEYPVLSVQISKRPFLHGNDMGCGGLQLVRRTRISFRFNLLRNSV
jgi:hypothetical protein